MSLEIGKYSFKLAELFVILFLLYHSCWGHYRVVNFKSLLSFEVTAHFLLLPKLHRNKKEQKNF